MRSRQDSDTIEFMEHNPDLEPLLNAARKKRGVPGTNQDGSLIFARGDPHPAPNL